MTAILGISAYYHDSAAAMVIDGKIVAAAQEERFSRKKHDARFPRQSINYCLQEAGMEIADLDYVGFYEKPLRKFDRLVETFLDSAPWGYSSFRRAVPIWVTEKLRLQRELRRGLDGEFSRRIIFCDHHESHAASAFYPSPFEEAAILTVDGVGEWATACYGTGKENSIDLTHEMRFPHSIGLLYSAFTEYLGFQVNSGEYKVMGLAPYGRPVHQNLILERIIELNTDGSFRLKQPFFNYCRGLTMTNRRFADLFGSSPRVPESPLTQRDMDIAASIQSVTEMILLRMARHVYRSTGQKNLVMAGGVALNCVANRVIERDGPFDRIWVQPAAGDAGGALGSAVFIHHQLLEGQRTTADEEDFQRGSLLGPAFEQAEIDSVLSANKLTFQNFSSDGLLCKEVARELASQKTVGWFQGRMEFGPRALGSRSILADPRQPEMAERLNQSVKHREAFRPFAPVILKEAAPDYFDVPEDKHFPYMNVVASAIASDVGAKNSKALPAVTHVDGTSRLQTAVESRHPLLWQLLLAFRKETGCPALLNTSFNVRGEPIVCRPTDALRCFLATDLDLLVIGDSILRKRDQTEEAKANARQELDEQMNVDRRKRALWFVDESLWKPGSSKLRRFGLAMAVGMPLIGWLCGAPTIAISWLVALGITGALLGIFRPTSLRPVYRVATIPFAVVAGEMGLLLIYIGIICPMGLASRALGRDPLQRRSATEYWHRRRERAKDESYFFQS